MHAAVPRSVFGNATTATTMFMDTNAQTSGCLADGDCVGAYCKGLPSSPSECLDAGGVHEHALRISGTQLDPTSYASLAASMSVLLQVFVFTAIGAVADHGESRALRVRAAPC